MATGGVHYNKDDLNSLINFYHGSADQVVQTLMKDASSDAPKLDGNIFFLPGSTKWDYAALAKQSIQSLAGKFATQYSTMEDHYATFAAQLTSARDVFDDTDDLAQYQASDFLTNYLPQVESAPRSPKG